MITQQLTKIDLRRQLNWLYRPSARMPVEVEVPPMQFLLIDGVCDPNAAPFAAAVAALDMAAERGGATGADRRHHLELCQAQMPGVKRAEAVPGLMQNICKLQRGAHVSRPAPPSPR